jgi:hypothetical protein
MPEILAKLQGSDRRSIGHANEIVRIVSADPALFPELFEGLSHSDPCIRMRSADAIEKITLDHKELLQPFKKQLLERVAGAPQKEVPWHVALMLPRLRMNARKQDLAVSILFDYLADGSSIVRTFSMQALADIALEHGRFRSRFVQPEDCRAARTLRAEGERFQPSRRHPRENDAPTY